ncbi:MAG: hypothetical protein M1297_10105, partial [Nitrospirae bacterium]|nr:hypothetical protein [Nitrospirota bacterium]
MAESGSDGLFAVQDFEKLPKAGGAIEQQGEIQVCGKRGQFFLALFPFRVASLPIRCRLDSGGDSHEEMHIPTMFSSCRLYDIGA